MKKSCEEMIDIFSQLFFAREIITFQVNISFLKGPYYNEYIKSVI